MRKDSIEPVLYGDRFSTLRDLKVTGLILWAAPCTGSFECILPEGSILIAQDDQAKGVTGFSCVPEKYKELEELLVPGSDRRELKYSGYCFSFFSEDIGVTLKRVSRASASDRKKYERRKRFKGWFANNILFLPVLYLGILVGLPFKPFIDLY